MTEDAWYDKYRPIMNHLDADASFGGHMFETYGPEMAFVNLTEAATPGRVWTIVTGDADELLFSHGIHYVNRLGYIIASIDHQPGDPEEVLLEA